MMIMKLKTIYAKMIATAFILQHEKVYINNRERDKCKCQASKMYRVSFVGFQQLFKVSLKKACIA